MPRGGPAPRGGITPLYGAGLGLVLVLAAWVRAGLIPAFERHAWEGHEAEYLAVFQGAWEGPWSTRVVPTLGWLYRGLGTLSHAPSVLIALSLGLGLLAIAAVVRVVRLQADPASALLAGLLVALYGNHAFWSSSAYNVMAPHALLLGSMALLGRPGWGAILGSGVLLGAAAGTRPELLVFALPVSLLLPTGGWSKGLVWGGTAALTLVACAIPMLHGGGYPEGLLDQLPAALAVNLGLSVFLAPFSSPGPVALAGALCVVALWRRPKAAAPWATALVVGHGSAAAFADAGFRQALMPGVALCVLAALAFSSLWQLGSLGRGPTRWLVRSAAALALAALFVLLAEDTADVARRYYAPAASLVPELVAAADHPVRPDDLAGCTELVSTPARAAGELGPFDPLDWTTCWVWREDWQHRRWTSLGVHDRARRLHRAFILEPLGVSTDPADPGRPPQQLWRVHGPSRAPRDHDQR